MRECRAALRYAGASLVGFAIDATLLHLGLAAGLAPAWARMASLACAMQATFALNLVFVFRCFDRSCLRRQWARYMAAAAFGNLCNYGIFVALVSTRWPVVARPMFALSAGSFSAWLINFTLARLLVFGRARRPSPRRAR